MFKRTKELSSLISEFHMANIKNVDMYQTQENILSFNSAQIKLKEIFDVFVTMK